MSAVFLLAVRLYGSVNEASGTLAAGKVYIIVYFPAAGIHPAKAAKYLVGALIKVLVYIALKLVYELLRRISCRIGILYCAELRHYIHEPLI